MNQDDQNAALPAAPHAPSARAAPVEYPVSPSRIKDLPVQQRPRETLEALGVENVPREILLAILLRTGVRGKSVLDLAGELLARFGSLTGIARASLADLQSIHGVNRVKAVELKAAFDLARRLAEESTPEQPVIRTPADAARLLREKCRKMEQETIWVLLLDARNRLKRPALQVTQGLLNASLAHPREIYCEAVRSACAAIVVVHNHPSGDPTPSAEDLRMTRQLVEAGRVVDIRLLDHIILGHNQAAGGPDFFSLRESGLVAFDA